MVELGRQILHMLFGAMLLFIANFSGRESTILLLAMVLFFGLILVHFKLKGFENPFVDFMLEKFDRKEVIPARGGLAYAAGALFLFAATDFTLAMGVTAILAFGDGFATLVGISGKHALPFNKKKTWAGAGAFILAGIASSMFFLGLQNAIIYSIFLAAVESVDFKVDDNILIPFSATILKTLLK